MTETDLQNLIRMRLSAEGLTVFRTNVGTVQTADGRFFDTGLPNGFSDLLAIKDGRACFIEVKVKPNKPSRVQVNFLARMRDIGCLAGVAYTVQDALRICEVGDVE